MFFPHFRKNIGRDGRDYSIHIQSPMQRKPLSWTFCSTFMYACKENTRIFKICKTSAFLLSYVSGEKAQNLYTWRFRYSAHMNGLLERITSLRHRWYRSRPASSFSFAGSSVASAGNGTLSGTRTCWNQFRLSSFRWVGRCPVQWNMTTRLSMSGDSGTLSPWILGSSHHPRTSSFVILQGCVKSCEYARCSLLHIPTWTALLSNTSTRAFRRALPLWTKKWYMQRKKLWVCFQKTINDNGKVSTAEAATCCIIVFGM